MSPSTYKVRGKMRKIASLYGLMGCLVTVLTGCQTPRNYDGLSVKDLYAAASKEIHEKNFSVAGEIFHEVEMQHPYETEKVAQAMIFSAYSYYRAGKLDEAVAGLDAFLELYPQHFLTPYAYYLQAICAYSKVPYSHIDGAYARKALSFAAIIERVYNNSKYYNDAKHLATILREHIALRELRNALFYLRDRLYIGAMNRFVDIIQEHPDTICAIESHYRLMEIYFQLGLHEDAKNLMNIMIKKFPNSRWRKDAESLFNKYSK